MGKETGFGQRFYVVKALWQESKMDKLWEKGRITVYKGMPWDWQGIPVLAKTDLVICGGSLGSVLEAKKYAGKEKKVLLALPESYLLPEVADTFRFGLSPEMCDFFPETAKSGKMLLPDEGKKYGEDFCLQNGIRLLYGVYLLDCCHLDEDTLCVRFGAKGGVFAILCGGLLKESEPVPFKGKETVSYGVLTYRQERGDFEVLKVSETVKGQELLAEGIDDAAFLGKMQAAAMDAFLEEKKKRGELILGRFAPKAYLENDSVSAYAPLSGIYASGFRKNPDAFPVLDRDDKEKSAEKERLTREGLGEKKGHLEEISFFTGNEFLKLGKYPLLGEKGRKVLKTSVMGRVRRYDVVVAGGGTAGAMAALYAARGGMRTALIEPQYVLGGTATAGGVSTYWFGNRFKDVEEIDRETDKLMKRLLVDRREGIWSSQDDFHPSLRACALQKLCLEAGVEIHYGQLCFGAVCEQQGEKIAKTKGVVAAGKNGITAYMGDFVIDATGDGDIAVFSGGKTVYGSEGDCITYWASLAQYVNARTYKNNFSTMVVSADPLDMTRFIIKARRLGDKLFDHGRYVSMRESRHLLAKTVVDLKDLMSFRTWEDGLYTCYSNYDPKGKLDADIVYCGVLPPQTKIQIPLSALLPCREDGEQIKGLYVAGKAIGATHNVFPSIRMQPDLMHQGAVLGGLLALCHKEKMKPEEMDSKRRKSFVRELTGDTLFLPEGSYAGQGKPGFLNDAVEKLGEASRTHWVDVPFTYVEAGQPEMLTVMLADGDLVCSLLKGRIQRDTRPYDWKREEKEAAGADKIPLRILLAGCLLWHGDVAFAREYGDYLLWQLSDNLLPKRKASVMCAQLLPDHGVMPEVVYGMNLLGRSKSPFAEPVFERVLSLLQADKRDYEDIRGGIYHYIESFARASVYGKSPVWIKWLGQLLDFREIDQAGEGAGDERMEQRLLILKLILSRALADKKDARGQRELCKLAENHCGAIAFSAQMALLKIQNGSRNGNEKTLHDWKFTY